METHVDSTLFKDALVILGAAAIVVPLFHSLKLSPVLGYIIIGSSADEMTAMLKTEVARWAPIVKASGAKAD